jgi:hypothetical protein
LGSRRRYGLARIEPPQLRRLNALLPSLTKQPPPSGGKFGGLASIDLRLPIGRLRPIKERFKPFELF